MIFKDRVSWLLLVFASIYIMGNIGSGSLSTWDEAIYANISASILKTGDWLIMHDGARQWFEKPPLYMWSTAVLYKLIGINEFSTRLTGAFFAFLTILVTYLFVKKNYGSNVAMLSALLLLASPHYLHYSKMGMLDVTLTFFVASMVFLFWEGQKKPYLLFWSGMALLFAYLTKGMAAMFGPATILLFCLLSGNARMLVKREFLAGISVSLFLILAWHFLQHIYGGPAAVDSYFGTHLFRRTAQALDGHTGGLNFYQKAIFNKNKPWGIIYYPALAYAAWLSFKSKDKKAILFTCWAAAVFIICTIVRTKLHWYIVPIYPALAVVSAVFLERFFKGKLFYTVAAVILVGMIIQVPISYAFKLDFNQKAKSAALNSITLPYEDGGTIFYSKTIRDN